MKTNKLFGIIALVAVIVFAMAACGGDDDNNGDPTPQTVTYSGTAGGTTYTLLITENTARYAAQSGDAYALTVGAKKSAGTVQNVSGGDLTLKPSNAEATFTATVSGTSITALDGTVTYDDETTDTLPGEMDNGEPVTNVFTSIADMTAWLTAQPANTAATPYTVKLNVSDLTGIKNALTKYVNLDLSGSTITSIPILTATESDEDENVNKTNLLGITIPNSVASIGDRTFNGCSSLTTVTIPASVTSIGGSAFAGCSSLPSVTIPASVTSIGNYVFGGCTSLASVTIPNSVTSIGDVAFIDCTSLESISIPDSITSIGGGAFNNTAWLNNQTDGLVYAGKVALTYKGTMPANTSINLLDDTKGIANSAFSNETSLTSITIPGSVTNIGESAFNGCTSLPSVTIPASVTSMENYIFSRCTSLTSITIPDSITSIGRYTFSACISLVTVIFQSTITSSNLDSTAFSLIGDLRDKYLATTGGGTGTYTRSGSGTTQDPYVWTKQ